MFRNVDRDRIPHGRRVWAGIGQSARRASGLVPPFEDEHHGCRRSQFAQKQGLGGAGELKRGLGELSVDAQRLQSLTAWPWKLVSTRL
jgi:hypothetical protein